jgi:hypothetical protein
MAHPLPLVMLSMLNIYTSPVVGFAGSVKTA